MARPQPNIPQPKPEVIKVLLDTEIGEVNFSDIGETQDFVKFLEGFNPQNDVFTFNSFQAVRNFFGELSDTLYGVELKMTYCHQNSSAYDFKIESDD